jgi:hypothetical protein
MFYDFKYLYKAGKPALTKIYDFMLIIKCICNADVSQTMHIHMYQN